MSKHSGFGLGFLMAAALGSLSRQAAALPLDGATELSVQGSLVTYESSTVKADNPQPLNNSYGDRVATPEVTTSSTAFGFLGPSVSAGLGQMLSENVLLGMQFGLATEKIESGAGQGSIEATNVLFLPRVEYVFDGDEARFYLAALAGYRHTSGTTTFASGSGSSDLSGSAGLFGFGVGVHGFVTDSCSLEPGVALLRSLGSQSKTNATTTSNPSSANPALDFSTSSTSVVFTLGIAAWLGLSHSPSLPAEPPAPSVSGDEDAAAPAPARPSAVASVSAVTDEEAPEPKPAPSSHRTVKMLGDRTLDLRLPKNRGVPSILVRVQGSPADSKLTTCQALSVIDGVESTPLPVSMTGTEERAFRKLPFVSGALPLEAVVAIGGTASLNVCGDVWTFSEESRAQVRDFLQWRTQQLAHPTEGEGTPGASVEPKAAEPSAPPTEGAAPAAGPQK